MENKFDLTKGTITRTLFLTATPLIIAMLVETGYNIVDTIFVGRLGPEAIAAVTLAFPVMFAMFAIGGGLATGTSALVARSVGAKNFKGADNVAEHSVLISIILSVILTVVGILTVKPLFGLLGAQGNVLDLVDSYVNVIYYGMAFLFLGMMGAAILRGVGDMRTQMTANIIGAVTNIILDPIFIFTLDMGVQGAAIATIISRGIACIYVYQYLFRKKTVITLSPKEFKYDGSLVKKIMFTGVPMSISQFAMAIGWASIAKIASLFGAVAVAAYGIGFRLDTVVILPTLGIGMALISIVGQNLGAGKPERAKASLLTGLGVVLAGLLVVSSIFYLFPEYIIRIFSSDPELISYGVSYLRSISPTYFFMGLSIIIGSAILGTGNPIPNMVLMIARVIVFAVPLSYLFAVYLGYGLIGVWWGIAISSVLAGFMSLIWYKHIKWERAVVDSS